MRFLILVLSVALIAGCAPAVQVHKPSHAVPALTGQGLRTSDAAILPVRAWLPEGEPLAVVVAVHGFNDYSNAFAGAGDYLSAHGIAVYAYDQRGFGAAPRRGIWPGARVLTQDLRDMVRAARARHGDAPLHVLGESMGGAVTLAAVAGEDAPPLAGVILVAPAVWGRDHFSPFYRATLWLGAHTFPWYTVTGRNLKIVASDNTAMLRAWGRDPLTIKETRIDALYGLVHLMDAALGAAPELKMPVLLLYGERDQIIPKPPVCHLMDGIPAPLAVRFYPRGYHMLLRDLQAAVVWEDVRQWIAEGRVREEVPEGAGCSGGSAINNPAAARRFDAAGRRAGVR